MSWLLLAVTLLVVLVSQSVLATTLPDYRWVVEDRQIILQPKDLGLSEKESFTPEGLTFAKNGDLLMAACCPGLAKTFIVRSADHGKTWKLQGVLEHKGEGSYSPHGGWVEGMYITRAGRLVLIYYILKQELESTKPGDPYYVPQANNFRFTHMSSRQWGAYSDDEGKTWHWSPMNIKPLKSMDAEASSQIFEEKDGTLVASFRGHITQEELDSGIGSNAVIRSHDGGISWGDVSVIARGRPGSRDWFNESQVVPLPDGRWLCMMRLNPGYVWGAYFLVICRSYSKDRGRTWSVPVHTQFHGGEPGMGFLPDGAVTCMQTGGYEVTMVASDDGWPVWDVRVPREGLVYEVSYDGGLTWSYWGDLYMSEPGSGEHIGSPIVRPLTADTAIAVYHRGSKALREKYGDYGPQFIGASWLRKAPASDPRAAALKTEPPVRSRTSTYH